jgi:hypothetical protein
MAAIKSPPNGASKALFIGQVNKPKCKKTIEIAAKKRVKVICWSCIEPKISVFSNYTFLIQLNYERNLLINFKSEIAQHPMYYISITGLKPKGILSFFRFWRLAIPSFEQARKAKGIHFCEVKRIKGYQCTLTAWESRDVMLDFMRSGVHLKAMKAFHRIATGRTFGYESETIPTWNEAFELLQEKGKNY